MIIIHYYKFPEWVSLGFIALALTTGIAVSMSKKQTK
jgi:tellurite resistance protein TerC